MQSSSPRDSTRLAAVFIIVHLLVGGRAGVLKNTEITATTTATPTQPQLHDGETENSTNPFPTGISTTTTTTEVSNNVNFIKEFMEGTKASHDVHEQADESTHPSLVTDVDKFGMLFSEAVSRDPLSQNTQSEDQLVIGNLKNVSKKSQDKLKEASSTTSIAATDENTINGINKESSTLAEFDMNEVLNTQSPSMDNKISDISSMNGKEMQDSSYGNFSYGVVELFNSSNTKNTPNSFLEDHKATMATVSENPTPKILEAHLDKNQVTNPQVREFDRTRIRLEKNFTSTRQEGVGNSVAEQNLPDNIEIKLRVAHETTTATIPMYLPKPPSPLLRHNYSRSMQDKREYNNESITIEPVRSPLKRLDTRLSQNAITSLGEHHNVATKEPLELIAVNTSNNNTALNVSMIQLNQIDHTSLGTSTNSPRATNNELEDSNEIFATSVKAISEKRAKFIHDNSTNMNQLNLPDASEVWTLVGMKAVPSKATQSAAKQYENLTSNEGLLNNNSITNYNEKNLLDWTQIMLTGDLNNKKVEKENFIESSTNTSSNHTSALETIIEEEDEFTTAYTTLSNLPPTNKVDEESYTISNLKAALMPRLTVRTTVSTPLNGDGPASSAVTITNSLITDNNNINKLPTVNYGVSDSQTPTQLPSVLSTSENSSESELENITISTTEATLNKSTFKSPTETLNVNIETTTTMTTTSLLITSEQLESATSPLPEYNFNTSLQTSPANVNYNNNEETVKTTNKDSDYEESTTTNYVIGEETTLEYSSSGTTTVSDLETSAVSTTAFVHNYDVRSNLTDLGNESLINSTTLTLTTILPRILYGENTTPNTTPDASQKVNEVDFDTSTTSERISTSSSTEQTYLEAEETTTSTTLSSIEETLFLTTTLTTPVEVLQKSITLANTPKFVEPPLTTTTETTTEIKHPLISTETTHEKQTPNESTKASIDMNFIDGPLNKTASRANHKSTDKLEETNNLKPVFSSSTTVGTFTPSTTTEVPMTSQLDDSTTSTLTSTSSSIEFDDISTTATTYALPTTTESIATTEASPSAITITTPITTMPKFDVVPPTLSTATHNIIGTIDSPQLHPDSADGPEMDVNIIIAISVSVTGIIALVLLVGFLYVVRKRQKQISYGHRCRPVSLDAYSLDNVSVYNSVRRKNAMRSSKRSYGNVAFDDPSLRHNVLNASELAKFIERRSGIFEEFKYVPQIIARPDEVPQGCEDKNRYANVIPIPETRVSLQQQNNDDKTEYINANYVRGPRDSPRYYIACQAPLESTVADFWRMVWEQKSRVIIQATDLVENGIEKCSEYLPPSVTLDNHTSYGDFQITLKNREVKDKYAISTIILKNSSNICRELTHYWYKWPDTGVPNEEAPIIAMLLEARSSLKCYAAEQVNEMKESSTAMSLKSQTSTSDNDPETKDSEDSTCKSNGDFEVNFPSDKLKSATNSQGPLTVHCSPGTGRTGTIIACDIAIRNLETPRRNVDIPQIVYFVRRGRASAVQTKEQYEFIYKVANMYATKITSVSSDN